MHSSSMKQRIRLAVRAGVFSVLAMGLPACANMHVAPGRVTVEAIPIAFRPQAPTIENVGPLYYAGGLYLTSRDRAFGGLSGLLVSEDGQRLLTVSDEGTWWTAKLEYREGRLINLNGARKAQMLGPNGEPLQGKGEADSESLAMAAGSGSSLAGPFYVSFERKPRIWLYPNPFTLDWKSDAKATPTAVNVPPSFMSQPSNGGTEALVALDSTTLLALSEDMKNKEGNFVGWIIPTQSTGGKAGGGEIALTAQKDLHPSDLALMPNGDVLVLERSFSLDKGAGMQLRHIKRSEIKPGAKLTGDVLARLDVNYSIDNMEGLAVRKDPVTNETLIYIISDDNFNGLQRTVLLYFLYKE